ncbi:MAG: FAD-dependent thymidylate synthase [bacterium]
MERKIFSVLGALPEPGGYAIAKFSRTAVYKSYQDWVMELNEEGAERFYNSFYFQYGHGSIADLAHLMVVFENISVPARNVLLDDQLIDAQSRSTRYVDFSKSVLIIPPEIKEDKELLALFQETSQEMISLYSEVIKRIAKIYQERYLVDKPPEMEEDAFVRLVRARAIDSARYLLPGAIPKSMGIIASARTWERIITKFLSSDLRECQEIGKELQQVICEKQAFNPGIVKINQADYLTEEQKEKVKKDVAGNNVGLPTLVKYAQKNEYPGNIYKELKQELAKLSLPEADGKRGVALYENVSPEIDLAATLLYKSSACSYGQLVDLIKSQPPAFLEKIIDLTYGKRGEHDPVVKEAATNSLIFDICMDIGGFRDLHRHRNCVQILKDVLWTYGFDMPKEIDEIGLAGAYNQVTAKTKNAFDRIETKYPGIGQYILPQAARRRFLMKMTPWELQYIVELRTRPQGHISYREIAYQMYQEFAKNHPLQAKHFRVVPPDKVDFFRR